MPLGEIAIIGMAGRFPGAADLEAFFDNLQTGAVSLGPISAERLAATTLDPEGRYRVMGYVDDVDRFDHAFFGIPFAEARTLSPAARLLLQEAWHAFETTGRPPEHFRGSRTDVYMTPADVTYCEFAPDEQSATMFTGNMPDFIAARISRQFDLRGTCAVVDSSCASGLSALLLACDALRLARADHALVCGAQLHLFPYARPDLLDTWSPDGSSRSYAAEANGMSPGEAAVCLVLTTKARAEAEGYAIHALIRGGASNHCGAMSSTVSAPNSVMQAEVMVRAWREAGVSPHELGLIEGHGSATLLGDSLELEAFRLAFTGRPEGTPCPLSSVKANIGHGQSVAALSGVVKTVLALRHGVLFPSPAVRDVNAVMQRPDSPVRLQRRPAVWSEPKRLAGVHALGMSGLNCHLVLENHEERPRAIAPGRAEWFPAPLSARTPEELIDLAAALRAWLPAHDVPLADVAHTLSLGRQSFACRHLVMARDIGELAHSLDAWPPPSTGTRAEGTGEAGASRTGPPRVVMVYSSDPGSVDRLMRIAEPLAARFAVFRRAMTRLTGQPPDQMRTAGDERGYTVAVQLALHELLTAMGLSGTVVGAGLGKLVTSAIKGAIDERQAVRDAAAAVDDPMPDLDARVSALVAKQLEQGPVVFVQMGGESAVSTRMRQCLSGTVSRMEVFGDVAVESCGAIVARLFMDGWSVRFDPWFEERGTRPARLPGYRFARTRCWVRNTPVRRDPHAPAANDTSAGRWTVVWAEGPQLERRLAEIARLHLGREDFGPDHALRELGADRQSIARIVEHVEQELGVPCERDRDNLDLTIAALARTVRARATVTTLVAAIWREVLRTEAVDEDMDFLTAGGHSLLASEILLSVRREFGVALTFEHVFHATRLRDFVALVEAHVRGEESLSEPQSLTAAAWARALSRRES